METTHTPGPLTLEREIRLDKLGMDPAHLVTEIQQKGLTIGYWIDCEWDGHGPNAKLYAAAPDLLEALRRIALGFERNIALGDTDSLTRDDMQSIAQATLAKAKEK